MVEDLKTYGKADNLSLFVEQWAVIPDCPIVQWCSDRKGSIGDNLTAFIRLCKRDPQVARVAHYHISHLMDDHMRNAMVKVVSTDSVQSARMWLEDSTISAKQADLLYKKFMCNKTGATEYAKGVILGELVPVKRNLVINTNSIIKNTIKDEGESNA